MQPVSSKTTLYIAALVIACVLIPAQADEVDDLIGKIAKYEYGQDAGNLGKLAELVVKSHADPARRKQIAAKLARLLDGDASMTAKQFVCKQLWRIGSAEVVPTLSRLLGDAKTADMARYALERMTDSAAGEALCSALGSAKGGIKVGIINSLGERRERLTVASLAPLVKDEDDAVARAAFVALGKIGGSEAATVLTEAKRVVRAALIPAADEALLLCAAGLAQEGYTAEAERVYMRLYWRKEASSTRAAALKGLLGIRKEGYMPILFASLSSDDAVVSTAAAGVVRSLSAPDATSLLEAALPGLTPHGQALMLHALAVRGDRAALPAMCNAARSAEPVVRVAAVEALGKLGGAPCVPVLAKAAGSDRDAEARAARTSLDRLRGADTDTAMIQALGKTAPKGRAALIGSLAARSVRAALPALWTTAKDKDESVRAASFQALRMLAGDKDLPRLVELMVREPGDGARGKAEQAVVDIAKRIKDPKQRVAAALAIFPATKRNRRGRCALLRVFGTFQQDGTLAPVRASLTSSDAGVRDTAIRVLADWKTPEPVSDLYGVAKGDGPEALRAVALKGYLRMLALPSDRPAAETLAMFEKGLALAKDVEAKRLAIAGLAEVPDRGAVAIIKRYAGEKDLKEAVDAALKKIESRTRTPSASHGGGAAKAAIDGDPKTRWTTGAPQSPGQWFMLDLGWETPVRKLVLDTTASPGDYPRGYEVYVSNNPKQWGKPVATGKGTTKVVEITFKPTRGRYLRIVQTGSHEGLYWSIHELKVETGE